MKYKIVKDEKIIISDKSDFVPEHILDCGQIFSYKKLTTSNGETVWEVYSKNKEAEIVERDKFCEIITDDTAYFENFFDLKTDYSAIKDRLRKFKILEGPVEFGYGIRILKQDLFETLIAFIISSNNNIKRIKLILSRIREKFGTNMGNFYAFPTRQQLLQATEKDFALLGAGYRAKYLFQVLRQVDEQELESWKTFSTEQLRKKLISLAGVGPKVADCVLLFGYGRKDVFPVDVWIEKMFWKYYGESEFAKNELKKQTRTDLTKNKTSKNLISREKIREFLTSEFQNFSGYAQQYLFYSMREEA